MLNQVIIQGSSINILGDEKSKKFMGNTLGWVAGELNQDCYQFNKVNFQDGDVFLDIGGNLGLLAIYLAKKHPFLKIYSFEADPRNFEIYQKHIDLNGLKDHKNLKVFNLAVSSNNKGIYVCSSYDSEPGGSYTSQTRGEIKIPSITLDAIFKQFNLSKIKFLKIDVEGAEYPIILASKLIKKHKVRIENVAMELHYTSKFRYKKFIKYLTNKLYLPELYHKSTRMIFSFEFQPTVGGFLSKFENFFDKYLYFTDSYLKVLNNILLKILAPFLSSYLKHINDRNRF
jgi:FkbM family methyltransferase